jgi:hypothetical protein
MRGVCNFGEKTFHLPSRIERQQHLPRSLAYTPKRVRNAARTEDASARLDTESIIANLKQKLAIQDVPPLVLTVMKVKDGACAR